jgi:hypothetical protein
MTEIDDFHAETLAGTLARCRRKISLPFQSIQIFLMTLIPLKCRSLGWQAVADVA